MFWCLPTALNKQRRLDIACNQNTIFEQLFPVLKHTISYKLLMKSSYLWGGTCEAEFAKWHGPGQGMSHRPNQNKPWKYSHFPFYPNADSPGAIKLIWYISTFLNLFSYLFQLTVGQILFKASRCFDNWFWKSKVLLSHSKLSLLVLSYLCFNVSKRAKHKSIFTAFNKHQSAQIKFIDDSSGVHEKAILAIWVLVTIV